MPCSAGLNPDQLRAVTHGDGPLLVVAGRRHRQDAGHHPADRLADRHAPRAAVGDPRADVHRQGRRGDGASGSTSSCRTATRTRAISTFHAFGDGLIREYALELGLPTDVRVLSRPEVVIFLREHLFEFELDAYRPLGDPTRFLAALATLFSRCKDEDIARPTTRPTRSASPPRPHGSPRPRRAGAPARRPATTRRGRRRAARVRRELARAYATYQELLAENGCIDFGDQVGARPAAGADVGRRRGRRSPAGFRYVLVDEFQDTNRAQAELVALLAEAHRNVTVVGDDDQAIYAFRAPPSTTSSSSRTGTSELGPSSCDATTGRWRRSSMRPTGSSGSTTRTVSRSGPAIVKRLRAGAPDAAPRPVRLEAFASGTDEADWIAAEIGRRVEAGAAPRDHAILVRANGHADPILRALNMAGDPVAVLRDVGPVCPPGGPAAAVVPAGRGRPGVERGRLRARRVRGVRAGRRGPDGHREHGQAAQPIRVGRPRRAGRAAGHPAGRRGHPGHRPRLVADLRRTRGGARSAGGGAALPVPPRQRLLARLAATDSVAAEEALANIARFFEIVRAQSAILADDRAIFVARHLETLIQAGDDPATRSSTRTSTRSPS